MPRILCPKIMLIKKVRYNMNCHILRMVLLMVALLFTVAIVCYHYTKHRPTQKSKKIELSYLSFH